MSYNNLHGYLIKDTQVKMLKKYLPSLIEGNSYDESAKGCFKLKSIRKYTWTSPDSNIDPSRIHYQYLIELEFYGTYSLWDREYNELNWKYQPSYRKRNIHRQLKYIAEKLIREYVKIIDCEIQSHNISVKKVSLKTKEA